MIQKRILVAQRLRHPPATGWSWVDRRFLREHGDYLSREAVLLYLFLAALSLPSLGVRRRPEPGQGLIQLGELFRQVADAATPDPRRNTP